MKYLVNIFGKSNISILCPNQSKFIWSVAITVIAICTCLFSKEGWTQKNKPNIIFICTDDQAAWTLGVSGNSEAITPNLDQLANQGAYLTNTFVTTPVCSPSRSSIFTGKYASQNRIPDFIVARGHKLFTPKKGEVGLDNKEITFVELLRKAGYATGLVGKWHLGDWQKDPSKKFHPTNYGFQYYMGLISGGSKAADAELEENGIVAVHKGFTDDILTKKAIQYVKNNKEKPFLLCLMYRAPHSPWRPVPKGDRAVYENKKLTIPDLNYPDLDTAKVGKMLVDYMANVATIDRNVGRILKELDALGISDNTIVIFTSDNGFNMGHNGIWHKGNGIWATKTQPASTTNIDGRYRPNLYDNSLKVPAIVKWPGTVRSGLKISNSITNLDWYPTILQMAGISDDIPKTVKGKSIVPLLKGTKINSWQDDVYAEYSMIQYSTALMRAYRTPEWKLVRDYLNPERDELYNLKTDPGEHHNLIGKRTTKVKEIVQELDQRIMKKMEEINDPLLEAVRKKDFKKYLENIE